MTLTSREQSTVRTGGSLVAGSVANLTEWCEFGIHGCFAVIIAARWDRADGRLVRG